MNAAATDRAASRPGGVFRDRLMIDLSLLVLRLAAGVIFFVHGGQKMWGWFDGPGLAKVVDQMGAIGYLVSIGEFFGGIGLIIGLLCRFSALSLIVIMAGAIAMVHGPNGFFLSNKGFEYNLALIGLLVPIVIAGPGRFAIGRMLPLPKSPRTRRPVLVIE